MLLMTCVKYYSERVKRAGEGSIKWNEYELGGGFEVVACIPPHILTEHLSLRHHQDIISHLSNAQNLGDFHIEDIRLYMRAPPHSLLQSTPALYFFVPFALCLLPAPSPLPYL